MSVHKPDSLKPNITSIPVRPTPQPPTSHSRLVTAKLTAQPLSSSVGWSRPSSVTPPAAASSAPNPNAAAFPHGPTAPQLPHAGKVIQPQLRTTGLNAPSSRNDPTAGGSNKTAWGGIKHPGLRTDLGVQNDFPTAAEVAQGVKII